MPENAGAGRTPARLLSLIVGLLLIAALGAGAVAVQAGARSAPPDISERDLLGKITAAPQNAPEFNTTVSVEQTLVPEGLIGASKGSGSSNSSGPRTARIWYGGPDRLRAELQNENGDNVFVKNGNNVRIYDGATNTLKVGDKPESSSKTPEQKAASPEEIDQFLSDIAPTSDLKTGPAVRVAGRWAYPLTLEPKDKSQTLVDRAEAYVDAEAFVPLSFELYAKDTQDPVVRYQAQNFTVGPNPDSRFDLQVPSGANIEQAGGSSDHQGDQTSGKDSQGGQEPQKVGSIAEAQDLVGFPVGQLDQAPGGRELTEIRVKDSEGVIQTYGEGFGTVVLAQHAQSADEPDNNASGETTQNNGSQGGSENGRGDLQVPTVDLGNGVEAKEISTPIGTGLSWSANGISYSLAGSVPANELEQAARGLSSR